MNDQQAPSASLRQLGTAKNTIFVQIASYRDLELLSTLRSCISNARFPENLRFCIAWQRSQEEHLGEFAHDPRFIILDIPYVESKGACWARNQIQKHYGDETYTLALDSHHRFARDWDVICIDMITSLQAGGFAKPLLTSYLPPYDPENDPAGRAQYLTKIDFDKYTADGNIFCRPSYMEKNTSSPVPARFVSAHFIFTLGRFCREVPHDPNYYFYGEEINLAVRAFTHGYDLFHPNKIICWHEYTRKGKTKHWDNMSDWHKLDAKSHARNRRFLGMEARGDVDFGIYDLGTVRSLRDYEQYAGLHFAKRAVQQFTLDKIPPPNPATNSQDQSWENSFSILFGHAIPLDAGMIHETAYDFCAVIYQDASGRDLHRVDLTKKEISEKVRCKKSAGQQVDLLMQFYALLGRPPMKWIVWPYSQDQGWLQKREGQVAPIEES